MLFRHTWGWLKADWGLFTHGLKFIWGWFRVCLGLVSGFFRRCLGIRYLGLV